MHICGKAIPVLSCGKCSVTIIILSVNLQICKRNKTVIILPAQGLAAVIIAKFGNVQFIVQHLEGFVLFNLSYLRCHRD